MMSTTLLLPELPYNEWEKTKTTLHLIFQIIGKTRLKLTPRKNHWWYITLYVSPEGFTTRTMPAGDGLRSLEIVFDIFEKKVVLKSSNNQSNTISLSDDPSIASFYKQFLAALRVLNIHPDLIGRPFDMGVETPFDEITAYHHYQWEYINRYHQIMRWVDEVFQEFSGRFYGKSCPVHIYWHHMDLAVTRFSGKKAPAMDSGVRLSDKDAYSHENISFGFWAGDSTVREPAFYSYTYPSPKGLDSKSLQPKEAQWIDNNGSPMAFLKFEDIRQLPDARSALLEFLESAYQAGAGLAGWPVKEWTVKPLEEL
jgi:hypothetical protein